MGGSKGRSRDTNSHFSNILNYCKLIFKTIEWVVQNDLTLVVLWCKRLQIGVSFELTGPHLGQNNLLNHKSLRFPFCNIWANAIFASLKVIVQKKFSDDIYHIFNIFLDFFHYIECFVPKLVSYNNHGGISIRSLTISHGFPTNLNVILF